MYDFGAGYGWAYCLVYIELTAHIVEPVNSLSPKSPTKLLPPVVSPPNLLWDNGVRRIEQLLARDADGSGSQRHLNKRKGCIGH
jgi:hypothetical protein